MNGRPCGSPSWAPRLLLSLRWKRWFPPDTLSLPSSPSRIVQAGGDGEFISPRSKRLRCHWVWASNSLNLLKLSASGGTIEDLSAELIVVVAYGKILPAWLIELPRYGIVNLHGSLLPKYRGASPINRAIANGDPVTGVCTMQIDEGMDTGPVYFCEETEIAHDETAPLLANRLAQLGASLLVRTLVAIEQGSVNPTPQDESLASMAPRLRKEDGYIDWHESSKAIHNKVRAFLPWPSVVVGFRGKTCRILSSQCSGAVAENCEPGTIVFVSNRLTVSCGDGQWLEIKRLQLENKNPVSGTDFANGVHLVPGDRFTTINRP